MQTGIQKWPHQIDGARKLVRLHPDQPDEGPATGPAHHPDDPVGPDPAVGLVIGVDADYHAGSEHAPPAGVFGEPVEAGERVRLYRRLYPLDRIAVVVVMRRLDQHQVEHRSLAFRRGRDGGSCQIDRFQLCPNRREMSLVL